MRRPFRCEMRSDGRRYAQNHERLMKIADDSRRCEIYILLIKMQRRLHVNSSQVVVASVAAHAGIINIHEA